MAAAWLAAAGLAAPAVWLANALTATSAAAAAQHAVSIANCSSSFCFQPGSVTAIAGDGVTWTNNTSAPHNISRCDAGVCSGQGPGTGADTLASPQFLNQSGTYSHTFSSTGTYFYYCSIHGYSVMHGDIVVNAAPTPPPTAPPTPPPPPTPRPTARPLPTSTATVHTVAHTPTAAPTATGTVAASSALAALPPTATGLPSATPSAPSSVVPAAVGAITTGSGAPVVPIVVVALLIVAALVGVGYRRRRRRTTV